MDKTPSLISLIERFPDAKSARGYLESVLWRDGVVCPHCGVVSEATQLGGAAGERGQRKCRPCRKKFTVCVGTIFEDTKIPLNKWVIACHLLNANKKGISALSLSRMLEISYECTWHMCHRIRLSMQDQSEEKLTGVVEADETYVGGKVSNKHAKALPVDKTPVVALVQRDGHVKARAVTRANAESIGPMLDEMVALGTLLMTDGAEIYRYHAMANPGVFDHRTVNHSAKEYARTDKDGFRAHTNTVESFNSLFKRCITGAWHAISVEHLPKYVDEVGFRWNHREVSDGERMEIALRQSEGRRLMRKDL